MKTTCAKLVGSKQFAIETVDFPPVNGSPIIRVTNVGICGSDVHLWELGDTPNYCGLVMGHEYSGIVEEPGNSGLKKGTRVVGYTQNPENEPCGTCPECLAGRFDQCTNRTVKVAIGCNLAHPGAYSQYVTWYPHAVYPLPDNVDNEEAAMIEPAAVGLHAVRLSGIQPGQTVLIMGGGIIGLCVAEWARTFGAKKIIMSELSPQKREVLQRFSVVDEILHAEDPELEQRLLGTYPDGVDLIFDCVAAQPTISLGLKVLRRGGTLVAVGVNRKPVQVDFYETVIRQKCIQGSKGHVAEEFQMVLRALASGKLKLKQYITARYPLEQIQEAFTQYQTNSANIKVMIQVN